MNAPNIRSRDLVLNEPLEPFYRKLPSLPDVFTGFLTQLDRNIKYNCVKPVQTKESACVSTVKIHFFEGAQRGAEVGCCGLSLVVGMFALGYPRPFLSLICLWSVVALLNFNINNSSLPPALQNIQYRGVFGLCCLFFEKVAVTCYSKHLIVLPEICLMAAACCFVVDELCCFTYLTSALLMALPTALLGGFALALKSYYNCYLKNNFIPTDFCPNVTRSEEKVCGFLIGRMQLVFDMLDKISQSTDHTSVFEASMREFFPEKKDIEEAIDSIREFHRELDILLGTYKGVGVKLNDWRDRLVNVIKKIHCVYNEHASKIYFFDPDKRSFLNVGVDARRLMDVIYISFNKLNDELKSDYYKDLYKEINKVSETSLFSIFSFFTQKPICPS